jgi:hypothetical protein
MTPLMRRNVLVLIAAGLLQASAALAQSGYTGVLNGTVRDAAGAPLAAAVVTVTSERLIGSTRSASTDAAGHYRVPALPRGTYQVRIALAGFRQVTASAQLQLGQSARLDATLEPGGVSEAPTPSPDAVTRESAVGVTHITSDFLTTMPIAMRFGPGAMLLAPGINPDNYSAYAAPGGWSNAYRIDDLDSADPSRGGGWVFPSLNWIDEVRVTGLGADAEQSGFTGASSQTVLRSGGNTFHGLAEILYRNQSLTNTNAPADLVAANQDLAPGRTDLATDTSVQVGGPIVRDAVWFFAGAHFYYARESPGGYPAATPPGVHTAGASTPPPSESSPRGLFKPTWRLSDRSGLSGFIHAEREVVQARGAAPRVAPEATLAERSSTTAWNGHLTRILSSSTVLDASYSGFHGADDLVPYNGDAPGWYDVSADYYSANSYYFYGARRDRHQGEGKLTRSMGAHDVALGGELDLGAATTTYGYPGGRSVDAASGVPYLLYLWDGSRAENTTRSYAAFAQDSWRLRTALTLDAGVRFERSTGINSRAHDTLYSASSVAPRVGVAWDVGGTGRTVVRAHYGIYYEAPHSADYDAADPDIAPLYSATVDRRLNVLSPVSLLQAGTNHTVTAAIDAPRTRAAVVGLEHRLFHGLVVGIYGIDRRSDRFIDDVLQYQPADFVKVLARDAGPDGFAASGDETTNTTDLFNQGTSVLRNKFVITNLPGSFRNYQGVEVTAARPMRGRWDVQGSWVMSRTNGNYDTAGPAMSPDFETPNTTPALQPFRTGRVANDTTHLAKVFGTYRLPFGVGLSGAFYYTSGRTFTRSQSAGLNQGRVDLFIEPRGSERYDAVMRLDARLQRELSIAGRRIRLQVDGFNVLNDATVTSRVTQSGLRYSLPLTLVESRRFRIGVAYRF